MDPAGPLLPIEVYTDGGCKPNPGPGGWGAVIRFADHEWFLSGNDPDTTNNQMELQAAVAALQALDAACSPCAVDHFTDSEYLRQGITRWIDEWLQNGWQTKDGEPVKNQELWQALYEQTQRHQIAWHWIKGHSGHVHNERADRLATRARNEMAPQAPTHNLPYAAHEQPEVVISVKVSHIPSQKIGAWGVVLRFGEHTRTLSHSVSDLSANALLIRGAAEALWAITRPCSIMVVSDADYLIRGASQWIAAWQARDWRTKDGKPVANRGEWEALLAAMQPHRVRWQLGQVDQNPDLALAGELATSSTADQSPTV